MDEIHFRQRFWLESIYLRHISFQALYGWFDTNYDDHWKKETSYTKLACHKLRWSLS